MFVSLSFCTISFHILVDYRVSFDILDVHLMNFLISPIVLFISVISAVVTILFQLIFSHYLLTICDITSLNSQEGAVARVLNMIQVGCQVFIISIKFLSVNSFFIIFNLVTIKSQLFIIRF